MTSAPTAWKRNTRNSSQIVNSDGGRVDNSRIAVSSIKISSRITPISCVKKAPMKRILVGFVFCLSAMLVSKINPAHAQHGEYVNQPANSRPVFIGNNTHQTYNQYYPRTSFFGRCNPAQLNSSRSSTTSPDNFVLPTGRRYYGGRYFGNLNNRYYGPQYGNF